jgi:anti-sigma-K factor RskA
MSDAPLTPEDDDTLLAAEYALGLIDGEELSVTHARAARDAGFAAHVARWQERLVAMTDGIAPVAPPKRAKKTLMARLFAKERVTFLQRLWVWKGISFAAIALVAYLAMPLLRPAPEQPGAVYATSMAAEDSTLQMLAVVDPARGDIALRRVAGGAPAGRVLELWALLPERAPISLGVLPEGDVARVALPADLAADVAQITLAVTDEPTGGAPEGVPTGTILAVGAVAEL